MYGKRLEDTAPALSRSFERIDKNLPMVRA